jgi:hypothetical protein
VGGSVSSAKALALKIGRSAHFLVGMGNDLKANHDQDDAYNLGPILDLHWVYLSGLQGMGGWPDWNAGGSFANYMTDVADKHGVVPMFTLYDIGGRLEGGVDVLNNQDLMKRWWGGVRLLFDRLAMFKKPAVVHVEPDFWAYMQQKTQGDPTKASALVKMVPDCKDQPDNLVGLGHCVVVLARKYAPKVLIGFHASEWGGAPADVAAFLIAVGAKSTDFVAIDGLDRDAGCLEAKTDPACQRGGNYYLDETNTKHPNFHDLQASARTIADATGKPMLWWQIPFGVPSNSPGGTTGHYRDNRVHYLFGHVKEFVDAGFVGATFGVGAGNQTTVATDNGQFKAAVTAYFKNPIALP